MGRHRLRQLEVPGIPGRVLSDCYGPFSTLHEVIVASAELPLLERGGTLRGKQPSSGVEGTEVAGRPVELEIACVAGNDEVIPEARRLVEEGGARAIVGRWITARNGSPRVRARAA